MYETAEKAVRCTRALARDFAGRLNPQRNGHCIDLTADGLDKAQGISDMLRLMGWSEEGMLVIGDGENDRPMIRRFSDCTVKGASDQVKREARAVYDTVGEALLDHL